MAYDPQAYLNEQTNQINALHDAQKRSQLERLQQARAKALGEQNNQKQALNPQYEGLRNQADVVANQNQNRMREMMAANGLSRSGENVTSSANLYGQRQSALNTLNQQQQQATNDIDRKISDINDPTEENNILAQIEAKRNEALMNLREQAELRAYQEAQAEKERAYQQAIAEQERAFRAAEAAKDRSASNNGTIEEQLAAIIAQQNQQNQTLIDEPTPEELKKYTPGKGVKSTYQVNKQKKLFDY